LDDVVENLVKMIFDFGVGTAQDANAVFVQIFCSSFVVFDLRKIIVDAAINFDFKLVLDTKVVEDVGTERVSPAEFQAGKATSA
jgi:hypothetical protein